MNKGNFNISRLSNFMQRQVTMNLPAMLIGAGAMFGTLLVVSLLVAYFNPEEVENLKGFYLAVFFFAGFILTSKIFSELHTPQRSYFYLTLPVSTLEKLMGSWLLSSLAYEVVYSGLIGIVYAITSAVAGDYASMDDMFDKSYFQVMGGYMVLQTIFLLGACYFRKNNFLKTLLSLFAIVIVIGLYAGLLGWALFGKGNLQSGDFSGRFEYAVENTIPQVAHILFWYVLAPFMLVVSYFTLKERQV